MELEIVDDLKQPEYTGENRCEPCTILNLVIAAVVGSLIARKSRVGGLLAVGVSIALIYLRGYLVPGTPTLTKRYLPPAVLRWFGKEPEPELATGLGAVEGDATTAAGASGPSSSGASASSPGSDDGRSADERDGSVAETVADGDGPDVDPIDPADGGDDTSDTDATGTADGSSAETEAAAAAAPDLETYFLEHDVLEPCEEDDDLCLTDEFEAVWLEEIDAVEASGLDVADAVEAFGFDEDPEAFDLDSRDDVQILMAERGVAGRWPSRAALLADVGASRALAEWTDDWDVHDPELKGQILNGLRMFLETCPTGGEISMSEETVESCCTSHEVFAVTCDETGERLFEQRLDAVEA